MTTPHAIFYVFSQVPFSKSQHQKITIQLLKA